MSRLLRCPVCDTAKPTDFFSTSCPIQIGRLAGTAEEAQAVEFGPVDLCFCGACEFIWNRSFDHNLMSFGPGYEYSLVHSPMFREYLESVAKRLINQYQLTEKTIVEIGCGRGEFLTLLCKLGGNVGFGFDPSISEEREQDVGHGRVTFIRDYYDQKYADIDVDFLCSLSVLEDIERPSDFLKDVRSIVGRREAKAYLEVFDGAKALANLSTWSVNYEMCNYWSPRSLAIAANEGGFSVLESGSCFGDGEYAYVDAEANGSEQQQTNSVARELPIELARFSEEHDRKVELWQTRLEDMAGRGARVAAWGTGAKGINFLNQFGTAGVGCVVDINPSRQGKFIPGSGHQVVSPEYLLEFSPNTIVITNKLYADEIRRQVAALGLKCNFAIA